MEEEQWRQLYGLGVSVSSLGRVKRLDSQATLTQSNEAYRRVWIAGRRHCVHRLVAAAFCGHTRLSEEHKYVDHVDRNSQNNAASNLRYATGAENNRNRSRAGSRPRPQPPLQSDDDDDEMWTTLLLGGDGGGEIVHVSTRGRVFTGVDGGDRRRAAASYGRAGEQGYLRCGQSLYVHRVVASAYVENADPARQRYVNHRDGNRHNNSVENLEWMSAGENGADAWQRKKRRCVENDMQVL